MERGKDPWRGAVKKRPRLLAGLPLKDIICSTVAVMKGELRRNMSRQKSDGEVIPDPEHLQVARNILELGRLMNRWQDIVGPALFPHTYPARLMHGNLQVVCADSQWLQTFQFYRELVREKVAQLFPGTPVRRIYSRIGTIPAEILPPQEAPWPDWHDQPAPPLPESESVSAETGSLIDECRKKLMARRQGLEARGFGLCRQCRANMVPPGATTCSVCLHRHQQMIRHRVRELVFDLPWLGVTALMERIPESTEVMIHEAREELTTESRRRLEEGSDAFEQGDSDVSRVDFTWEIMRYLIFKTGLPPHEIDFDEPFFQGFLPEKCVKWALIDGGSGAC